MFPPSVRPCLSVLCLGGRGGVFPGRADQDRDCRRYGQQQATATTTTTTTPGADAEFRAQNSEPKNWGRQGVEGCTSPQDSGQWSLAPWPGGTGSEQRPSEGGGGVNGVGFAGMAWGARHLPSACRKTCLFPSCLGPAPVETLS